MKTVSVEKFAHDVGLEIAVEGRETFDIYTSDINRVAMQIAGYFEHFAYERIQLMGNQELGYMASLDEKTLEERFEKIFSYDVPVVVVCNGDEVPKVVAERAKAHNVPVLKGKASSSKIVNLTVDFLNAALAREEMIHANMLEVHNVGVMIRGESGVGKSELTLELVKRGHRMVADDVTVIKKVAEDRLIAYAPPQTQHLMEVRGVGIIDIMVMYGMTTVLDSKSVDIVIDMEMWDKTKDYDRLGFDRQYISMMDVKIPHYVMPVHPGRNLAALVEVTAMDYRLKNAGYNAEKELNKKIEGLFSKQGK